MVSIITRNRRLGISLASMEFSVTLPSRITADVSFNETVRFVGITGPSGAGKSSLLRALAGVEPKSDVVVDWGGRTSKIGIVFQQPMLFPHVNVRGILRWQRATPQIMLCR